MDFIWWRWPKERGRQIQAQCSRLGIRQGKILDIGGSSRGWTSRADWGSSWKRHRWKGGDLGRDEGFHPPILNLGRLHIVTISYIQQISYITPSNIEPGQAAYQEGGDDGDEHKSESLLATSATSSLSHLMWYIISKHLYLETYPTEKLKKHKLDISSIHWLY